MLVDMEEKLRLITESSSPDPQLTASVTEDGGVSVTRKYLFICNRTIETNRKMH